jgi:MFS family permease
MSWWSDFLDVLRGEVVSRAAALLVAAVLSVLAVVRRDTLGRWLRRRHEQRENLPVARSTSRQRQLLALSMRRVWIDGYLRQARSEGRARHLPVTLSTDTGRGAESFGDLTEIWDRAGPGQRRKIRLLGAWGTGKTYQLLSLAENLLQRSQDDRAEPVPIVADISGWSPRQGSLAHWLLDEIVRRHRKDVSPDGIRELFARGQIALLLDGLDENPRPGQCAAALNAMLEADVELAVLATYRSPDDGSGVEQQIDEHLGWLDAVRINRLQPAQVIEILRAECGRPRVLDDLARDNVDLWEPLLSRPLIVGILLTELTSRDIGTPIGMLIGPPRPRPGDLYELYLDHALTHSPALRRLTYGDHHGPGRVRRSLTWLAHVLESNKLGTTAYVDRLAPAWIPDPEQRRRARRARTLTFAAVIGLLWGLVAAGFWAVGRFGRPEASAGPSALGVALAAGLYTGLVYGLALAARRLGRLDLRIGCLSAGCVGAIVVFGLGVAGGLGIGVGLGLAAALLAGLDSWHRGDDELPIDERHEWRWGEARRQVAVAVAVAAAVGIGITAAGALAAVIRAEPEDASFFPAFGAMLVLLLVPGLVYEAGLRPQPMSLGDADYPELLRRHLGRSILRGLIHGMGAGLFLATLGWAVFLDSGGLSNALTPSAAPAVGRLATDVIGLTLGFGTAGVLTGCLSGTLAAVSYVVVQRRLRRLDVVPAEGLLALLEAASDGRTPLLVCVGRGYKFLHPTFQDHLAAQWSTQPQRAADRPRVRG